VFIKRRGCRGKPDRRFLGSPPSITPACLVSQPRTAATARSDRFLASWSDGSLLSGHSSARRDNGPPCKSVVCILSSHRRAPHCTLLSNRHMATRPCPTTSVPLCSCVPGLGWAPLLFPMHGMRGQESTAFVHCCTVHGGERHPPHARCLRALR
jgi:hypothetical protein